MLHHLNHRTGEVLQAFTCLLVCTCLLTSSQRSITLLGLLFMETKEMMGQHLEIGSSYMKEIEVVQSGIWNCLICRPDAPSALPVNSQNFLHGTLLVLHRLVDTPYLTTFTGMPALRSNSAI
jgi:hypothetical protein